MKTLLLIALLSMIPTLGYADEDDGDEAVAASDVVLDRQLGASPKTNALHLRVHKAGHMLGKPYVIEIAEACQNGERIIDTHSVCDIALNTAGYDASKGEIQMLVRDPSDNASGCALQAKRVVFRLQSACNQ